MCQLISLCRSVENVMLDAPGEDNMADGFDISVIELGSLRECRSMGWAG